MSLFDAHVARPARFEAARSAYNHFEAMVVDPNLYLDFQRISQTRSLIR